MVEISISLKHEAIGALTGRLVKVSPQSDHPTPPKSAGAIHPPAGAIRPPAGAIRIPTPEMVENHFSLRDVIIEDVLGIMAQLAIQNLEKLTEKFLAWTFRFWHGLLPFWHGLFSGPKN